MMRVRSTIIKAVLFVLGLSSLLQAQSTVNGPVYCPPLDSFLSPTLLDIFLYPGITYR